MAQRVAQSIGNNATHFCSIIPPHILQAIVSSDAAHPAARESAQHSLSLTQSLHAARRAHCSAASALRAVESQHAPSHSPPPPPPPAMGIVPPHIHQSLAQSEHVRPEHREAAQQHLAHDELLRALRTHPGTSSAPVPAHLARAIYSCMNGTSLPGVLLRSEGQPAVTDISANECYDGFGSTFTFYNKVYNRNSIDDAGLTLLGSLHYSQRYNNAFWNGRQMVFGDGDGVYFNRFTSAVDVIGHELTHGVVQYTCNLEYQDEAGALNESLADCFGSMVKQYQLKQTAADADWLIGEGIFTSRVHGKALRSMKAPGTAYDDPALGKDPQPANYSDLVVTDQDAGGVHINSGIPNHAFYLAAVNLGGYTWDKAGKVWYATMLDRRLTSTADFKSFANLTIENAGKLFDQSTQGVVTDAWNQVGVLNGL